MMPVATTKASSNKARFAIWKGLALADRKTAWKLDSLRNGRNSSDLLMHRGKKNGYFISVERDGTVRVGVYRGALPSIANARFSVWVSLKCDDFQSGVSRILNACGLSSLIGLFE